MSGKNKAMTDCKGAATAHLMEVKDAFNGVFFSSLKCVRDKNLPPQLKFIAIPLPFLLFQKCVSWDTHKKGKETIPKERFSCCCCNFNLPQAENSQIYLLMFPRDIYIGAQANRKSEHTSFLSLF